MQTSHDFTIQQLNQALKITERIDSLKQQLASILGGTASTTIAKAETPTKTRRRMSAATRVKMSAAQQARRAKAGSASPAPVGAPAPMETPKQGRRTKATVLQEAPAAAISTGVATPKKKGLTAEGRAKLAAAMKARWAARKKGAPAPNASERVQKSSF